MKINVTCAHWALKTKVLVGLFTLILCLIGTNSAWADVTASVSGSTLTFSYSGSGSSAMTDYVDADGSSSPKRPTTWVYSVNKVVINEGVTTIGSYAFQGCSGIKEIHIPTSVTECKAGAFVGCTGLASIYYAGTPNQWAGIDFGVASSECTGHPFYATTASNHSFYFYDKATETKNIVFSAGLTQIKPYAFYKANYIEDVYIPGTVTSIGNYALYSSIKRLYINKSVAPTTGTNAISWLTSGTYIYLRSDATNSYNKTPWINTTSGTSTGAKNIGYNDYSATWVTCSWKTGKLHKVSGTVNNIDWVLSEDGTLTLTGNGAIATTFGTTSGNSNLLPWFRFRRLVNKVIIKAKDGDITGISNAIQYCYAVEEITIAQTTVPTATFSVANDFKKTTDLVNVYADTSSEFDDKWEATPWNNSRLNVTFTTTFCSAPSDLEVSSKGTTSATFTWADDSGDTWKYLCVAKGTTVTSSMWDAASSTTSKTATVSSLSPATNYTFYVLSDCGTMTSDELSVDFTTDCNEIAHASLPWSYGFEGATTGATPPCWAQLVNGSAYAKVYSTNTHTGSRAMHISGGKTSQTIVTAIFPEFEDDITDLALSFWYKTSVNDEWYTYGQPQIGYISDIDDPLTFEGVGSALAQNGSYVHIENVTFPAEASGARIAIQYTGGSDNGYVYLDDITIDVKPSCNKPTGVSAGSETAEGATITWNANDMSAWKLQVSEGDAASWGSDISVATNSKVLTGLKANTTYYVRVKADCGGGSVSDWSDNVLFTTLCGTVNVTASSSWTNDFQALSDNVIPGCWDNTASTTTSSWGDEYIWGTYSRLGERMLRMDNQYCNGGVALINTPSIAIPNDDNSYELTFDYSNMTAGNMLVKISANGGVFEQKGSYISTGSASSYPGAFTRATISLEDYNNKTIKIQFYATPASGTLSTDGAMFVDNVSVHKVPTCFTPTAMTFGNLTANSASVSWTNGGEESAWRLQYRTAEGAWSADQAVSSKPYTLTGLTANTEYFVRVKSYCAADDQSEWSVVGSFTTLCTAESMPFEESFSSATELPDCWVATSTVANTYKWSAYENSGAYSAQLRTGSSGEAELRLPPISLSVDAILRFEWKNANGANVNVYISTDGGTTKTLLANDLSGVHSDWTTKIIDLSDYTGETALIYFKSLFSTANKYAYLDDVEVVARPCDLILNIQAAPITGGATISWSGSAKKLQYKTGSADWTSVTIASGDYSGPKTITGLTPARTYQVRLLPACSEDQEANYTTPVFFMSNAIESVPYYNDFESETPGELPFNWSRVSSSDYPQVAHDSYAWHEGFGEQGNSVKFSGVNDQILVLPEFNVALKNLSISFHHRNRDCTLQLGYVAADGVTFTAIATLPTQSGYAEFPYEKVLKNISASASKLAIRYSGATGASSLAYIENVRVEEPTCAQPESLTLGTVTANSAQLSWSVSELGTEMQYQYIRRVASADDPDWSAAVLLGEGVREVTLSSLSANTNYEFYLRSYCDASHQSTPLHLAFKTALRSEVFEDVASATNNETRLAALNNQTVNVTINRPLQRNGDFSTLTLPFSLTSVDLADPDCPLHEFEIKQFERSEEEPDVVNVYLTTVRNIEAGKPYFVRYAGTPNDEPMTPLVFQGVQITRSTPVAIEEDGFTPHGVFNPYALTAGDVTTLFLSADNTLYYPSANGTMNGFRAYIKVSGSMSAPVRRGLPIRICESKNVATDISNQQSAVSCQKVLRDGQLLIIRDGKTYNAQGQMVK